MRQKRRKLNWDTQAKKLKIRGEGSRPPRQDGTGTPRLPEHAVAGGMRAREISF